MSDVAPRRKLRALELKTAESWRRGRYSGPRVHETKKDRDREAEFAEQMETAYRRLVADWQPKPTASGAGATWGRASQKPPSGKQRGKATVPNPALELVVARTNNDSRTKETNRPEALTFISVREPHGSEGFSFGREYAHPHDPAFVAAETDPSFAAGDTEDFMGARMIVQIIVDAVAPRLSPAVTMEELFENGRGIIRFIQADRPAVIDQRELRIVGC